MATLQFGNTWWGKEWLNAFNHIYDSNRLPRGRIYARNGSVISLEVTDGSIYAQVQGSARKPYQIEINVPTLTLQQKESILGIVNSNPYYLGKLVQSNLPNELNSDLINQKIYLFPNQWSDFSASCSCPDHANPCKHLAATIYMVANQIDLDPFLIMKLKGFDLLKAVNALHGKDNSIQKQTIKSFADLNVNESTQSNLNVPSQINFNKIENLHQQIFNLLPQNPLFLAEKNYHSVFSKHYAELRNFTKWNIIKNDYVDIDPKNFLINPIQISPELECKIDIYNNSHKITSLEQLFAFVAKIPNINIDNNPPRLNALYLVFNLLTQIVNNSAMIPQLYTNKSSIYLVRYIPILNDQNISLLIANIASSIPEDFVIFDQQKTSKIDQILWLFAALFKYISTFSSLYFYNSDKANQSKLYKINQLFLSIPTKFKETDLDLINHINLWLGRFEFKNNPISTIVQINEKSNKFTAQLLVKNLNTPNKPPLSVKQAMENSNIANDILHQTTLVTEYIPALISSFSTESSIALDQDQVVNLFFDILPTLKLLNINVLLPKSLNNLLIPKLKISVSTNSSSNINYFNLDQMLDFDWQISLGAKSISIKEFRQLLKDGNKLIKLKNDYVYLDPQQIDKILNEIDKPLKNPTGLDLLRELVQSNDELHQQFTLSPEVQKIIKELLEFKKVTLPKQLNAELRDYQYSGYSWLYKNIRLGFGCIIADDMGLGKTLQVITCILKLKQEKLISNTLVIVPTSLLTNWHKELQRFAPSLSTSILHGKNRTIDTNIDIILTTYGMIRQSFSTISSKDWDLVVIDEAQNIKNLATKQTKLIKSIKTKYRIAMSGTPIENKLLEYYSIMDFANKGYLGNTNFFNTNFAKPIEVKRDTNQLNKFISLTKPFVLRRLKNDKSIIKDLPDKIVIDEYCNLSKEQASLYQATLDNIMQKLNQETEEFKRQGLVLNLITALKQICNHPSQYLKQFDNIDPNISGKATLLIDKVKDIHAQNEKVLIFTQFTEMGNILQSMIESECKSPVLFLHGGTSRKKRDEMVELIQTNPFHQTMILSVKAGGVGLNLTGANHVIHYDLWWNPAVENQATDRAYRIKQTKNVFVHRMICSNSFEEKINQMLKDKQELANLAVATGEQWIGNLNNQQLKSIFELEKA